MRFSVIGLGSWGTALAQVLADNGHEVWVYGREEDAVEEVNSLHANSRFFPGVKISEKIVATSSFEQAIEQAEGIVISVPSSQYGNVLNRMLPLLKRKVHLISTAKGFEPETNQRLSEEVRRIIPEEKRYPVVSLVGPSHAEEVILRLLTCITSTCLDLEEAKFIQQVFSNSYFRVYTNLDEIGAECAAACKNVIAIASGILVGLGYGDNTKAALITRGLAEMMRFGLAQGGQMKTYLGLTGLGDLMVTCSSYHSRNFQAGLAIGKQDSSRDYLAHLDKTVEGIRTSSIICQIAKEKGIEMPISEAVKEVLFDFKTPSEVVSSLMSRPLKGEF